MNRTVALSAGAAIVVRTLIAHYKAVLLVGLLIWFGITHPDAVVTAFDGFGLFVEEVSS